MDGESLTPEMAFVEAVRLAGGQSNFEQITGMSQQRASYRLGKGLNLPAEFVLAAERATGISRHALRPDLYPIEQPASTAEAAR